MGLKCLRVEVDGAAEQGLLSFHSLYLNEVPGNLLCPGYRYRPLARDETRPDLGRCFALLGGWRAGRRGEMEAGWRNVCVM